MAGYGPGEFAVLSLRHVQEGQFLRDVEAEFRKLQSDFITYRKEHGDSKAKARLDLSLILLADEQDESAFGIKATMKISRPIRPAVVNVALAAEDPDGVREVLFVRASGGDETDPRQGKMFTEEGKPAAEAAADLLSEEDEEADP